MKKIDVKKIIEFFQSIFEKNGDAYARNPHRSWAIIISTGTILFLFLVFLHYQIFLQINDEKKASLNLFNNAETKNNIDIEALNNILKTYDEKEKKFEELKNNKPNITDPSL